MELKQTLLRGIVACTVTTILARALGAKEQGARIGVVAGVAVAFASMLSSGDDASAVELEDELTVE